MSEDAASPEDKLRIASHFILSAPNGEVDDVIADVKTLLGPGSLLTDDVIARLLKQYNTEQYVFAPLASGHNLPCTKFGLKDSGKYLNPTNGALLSFDHVKREWLDEKSADSASTDTPSASFRNAVETALAKYTEAHYVNPKEYGSVVYDQGDKTLVIVISAKKANLTSYWSGGWKATYFANLKTGKLKSSVNVNVHYFEEGNIQLNTNIDEEKEFKVDDPEGTAKAIVDLISAVENKFQKNMEEMYNNMHTQTFKAMRRFLPVTRSKMDWNPASHMIASTLTKE